MKTKYYPVTTDGFTVIGYNSNGQIGRWTHENPDIWMQDFLHSRFFDGTSHWAVDTRPDGALCWVNTYTNQIVEPEDVMV